MDTPLFFHALNSIPGVGGKTLRELVGVFGNAEAAWEASPEAWATLPDIGAKTIDAFRTTKASFDFTAATLLLQKEGIRIIPFTDPNFPESLKEIPTPPALLYVRGKHEAWQAKPLIAIVGSRKYTHYGKQATEELTRGLVQAGFGIVSGLAYGIDGIAHEAALEEKGVTMAVLGTGNDTRTLSPQAHLHLAERIIESGGAVISEFSPGTPGNSGTFPARNRIMAGMTMGTIVIEAAEGSGSLITAHYALEYNREVFAVPGSIFSEASQGTNALLKAGAKVVTGLTDILDELTPHLPHPERDEKFSRLLETLSPEEKKTVSLLSHEPLHIDKIIEASRLETMFVTSLLTKLEMQGVVKNIGGMQYIRIQ